MIDFGGQVVVVTGAGRGLGRSYALLLARRGATVVHDAGVGVDGAGADPAVADGVVAEIRESGGEAEASYEDLGDRPGVARSSSGRSRTSAGSTRSCTAPGS